MEFISSNQANTASIDVLSRNSLERMWRGLVCSSSMVVADYNAHRAERKLTFARQLNSLKVTSSCHIVFGKYSMA